MKKIFDIEIQEGMLDSKQFKLEVFVYDLFESDHEKLFPKLVLGVLSGYSNTSKQSHRSFFKKQQWLCAT